MLEYNFDSHKVFVDGIPITGKLDKIEFLSESGKEVRVVDYKTGNPEKNEFGDDGQYKRQIVFYKLLCDLSKKFPFRMIEGVIEFIEKNKKTGEFITKKVEITNEDIVRLKSEIVSTYRDIMDLTFLDPSNLNNCGECEYCIAFNEYQHSKNST